MDRLVLNFRQKTLIKGFGNLPGALRSGESPDLGTKIDVPKYGHVRVYSLAGGERDRELARQTVARSSSPFVVAVGLPSASMARGLRGKRVSCYVVTTNDGCPARGRNESGYHPHGGRFAGTIGP